MVPTSFLYVSCDGSTGCRGFLNHTTRDLPSTLAEENYSRGEKVGVSNLESPPDPTIVGLLLLFRPFTTRHLTGNYSDHGRGHFTWTSYSEGFPGSTSDSSCSL